MGIVAVIVAAVAGFAFGAVWYMSLSGPWLRATGMELDAQGQPALLHGSRSLFRNRYHFEYPKNWGLILGSFWALVR